jgi:SAM-dependent methyltransferase
MVDSQPNLQSKSDPYFEYPRTDMLQFLPRGANRVLDVGCGAGAFGVNLKETFGCEVWGVEPHSGAVALARTRIDHALPGFFTEQVDLPNAYFDCIFFNDVLEHMADPGAALVFAQRLLAPGGKIVASIPNIAHFPTVWRLVFRGQWRYADDGILDRTHLRFFTRSGIETLLEESGYRADRMEGIGAFFCAGSYSGDGRFWKLYRALSLFPNRHIKDMRFLQFGVVASMKSANS